MPPGRRGKPVLRTAAARLRPGTGHLSQRGHK